jgi:hypothetical protein
MKSPPTETIHTICRTMPAASAAARRSRCTHGKTMPAAIAIADAGSCAAVEAR